jgi:hypothetical protein
MEEKPNAYLHSSTFWVLLISAPILWGLVIYLLARVLIPAFR